MRDTTVPTWPADMSGISVSGPGVTCGVRTPTVRVAAGRRLSLSTMASSWPLPVVSRQAG